MFKAARIAILLYVLLFVAVGQVVSTLNSTDWREPLWIDAYPVDGDGSDASRAYIEHLDDSEFAAIETFFAREAQRYGVPIDAPVRFALAPPLTESLPELPAHGSVLAAMAWSLRMRWLTTKLNWRSDRPRPDIVLYLVYHDGDDTPVMDRSGALRKGLIAVTNVFAGRASQPSNQVVIAHELLHTLGATDKYDPATNLPLYPIGFADPEARPLLPQRRAEIMAGRIPINEHEAQIPWNLDWVEVGAATAAEIRWVERP